ncbi:MAG: amino acid ABC transporter substrate-binding protein, partial [Planctomycetes bacterium]|nr:amino acid ABC transporter substrate-binding protein [Planctomycetota bacterium]
KHGISFNLDIIPWKRCQAEVENGVKYQMFLSGGLNPSRLEKYHITQPYYFTRAYYFWALKHHPNGLNIRDDSLKNTLHDLTNKYKMGNVLGYGMGIYKSNGIDISNVYNGAPNYKSLEQMLLKGRVDVFYEAIEIIEGLAKIGVADITQNPDIRFAAIPGMTPRGYQMMFSKNYQHSLALRNLIDPALTLMRATGRLDALLNKYLVNSNPIYN